jgi:hypothetical protein
MLSLPLEVLYDVGDPSDPAAGDCVPGDISDPTAVSRQVAARLRAQIYSGALPAGAVMPTQKELVGQYGGIYSEATMYRALAELARDKLVTMGQGRKTTVLELRRWRATVTVRWAGDPAGATAAALDAASSAIAASTGADPAVSDPGTAYVTIPAMHETPGHPGHAALAVEMTVLASDFPLAMARAWAITLGSLRGHDGWDLVLPRASVTPA